MSSCTPDKFPRKRGPGIRFVEPTLLSFVDLMKAIEVGFVGIAIDKWSLKILEEYYKACSVNGKGERIVYELAKKARKDPTIYHTAAIPKLWPYGYNIDIFIDPPMHQFFHGVVPSVIEMIENFLQTTKLIPNSLTEQTNIFH